MKIVTIASMRAEVLRTLTNRATRNAGLDQDGKTCDRDPNIKLFHDVLRLRDQACSRLLAVGLHAAS